VEKYRNPRPIEGESIYVFLHERVVYISF
jgi:hypothetical protein